MRDEKTPKIRGTKPRLRTRADAGERAIRAWALRVGGASWHPIAEELGFNSAGNACRAVTNYFGEVPEVDRNMHREIARQRTDYLWRQAMRDVNERRGGAIQSAVAVLARQARLDGLDAPTRSRVSRSDS